MRVSSWVTGMRVSSWVMGGTTATCPDSHDAAACCSHSVSKADDALLGPPDRPISQSGDAQWHHMLSKAPFLTAECSRVARPPPQEQGIPTHPGAATWLARTGRRLPRPLPPGEVAGPVRKRGGLEHASPRNLHAEQRICRVRDRVNSSQQ